MYKTAWNITFEKKINFEIEDLNFVESVNLVGTYTYFFYWKTYKKTSIDLLKELQEKAWTRLVNHEVSISCEDEIDIYTEKKVEGIYTIITIEWASETFQTVVDKFIDSSPFIVCIRESENSPKFGNRMIKIDIVSF
jgi:hypothetical protein